MNQLTIHAGDIVLVNGAQIKADRTVKLSCDQPEIACEGGRHSRIQTTNRGKPLLDAVLTTQEIGRIFDLQLLCARQCLLIRFA